MADDEVTFGKLWGFAKSAFRANLREGNAEDPVDAALDAAGKTALQTANEYLRVLKGEPSPLDSEVTQAEVISETTEPKP